MEAEYDAPRRYSQTCCRPPLPNDSKDPTATSSPTDTKKPRSVRRHRRFTERASGTTPCDLVLFLDRLYGTFDALADKHGLEKIKVSATPTCGQRRSRPGLTMSRRWRTSPRMRLLPPD